MICLNNTKNDSAVTWDLISDFAGFPSYEFLFMSASSETPKPSLELAFSPRLHSSLAFALLLLPKERRRDAFLFYDFCRAVDDIADHGTASPEERRELLNAWMDALTPAQERNLPVDFVEMIGRRKLDRQLLSEIVLGMMMDISPSGEVIRYSTFDQLHHYCWRAASVVGLVSAEIFGASGAAVREYAEQLGIALQLTNILRDVAEDAVMNRIYIPQEDLERFAVTEEEIFKGIASPQMIHLLNHQGERADSYFAKTELAWIGMSAHQRRLMRPARLMSAIYRKLLLLMHRDRYDVFHTKYRLSTFSKLSTLLTILLQTDRHAPMKMWNSDE